MIDKERMHDRVVVNPMSTIERVGVRDGDVVETNAKVPVRHDG